VSSAGEVVTLCLFGADGAETRLPLPERDGEIWHGFVPDIGPGQAYGYRVDGPWDPARGFRCDPGKLLLDPYARAIAGDVRFDPAVFGRGTGDSAPSVPRSLVVAPGTSPGPGPRHALADTVIYELHVKGFTMRHPGVPPALRGTYAGLAHPAAIAHLVDLGVTAVELLPVQHNVSEPALARRGLTNYWGYNTIGFFAPHAAYATAREPGGAVAEFRDMVAALHAAGLDVLLDVVYNHTAEAGADGPTLCHRGLHDGAYYHLDAAGGYVDTTGCGNALNAGHPLALRMVMDSLRYWVTEMGVDGFRFDLAPTLARPDADFDAASPFFDLVAQDPVLSAVTLIAEPWDVGRIDSYDLGRFPANWSEWNGRFRDTVRDFWRSHDGLLGEFASRICGSADVYAAAGRRPTASIDLVTVHDGFTLRDLVSYNGKHDGPDGGGSDDDRSWNCGVEGPTDDPAVLALRARQSRALLATVLLSGGVPLLLGGDEIGRTQRGHNNPFDHDDELSWFDWAHADTGMLAFTRDVIRLRRAHPLFGNRFLTGADAADLTWFTPAGTPMTAADWAGPGARAVAVRCGSGTATPDDDQYLLVNAWWEPLPFALPDGTWEVALDTFAPERAGSAASPTITADPRSLVVLRRTGA
jgi:isoamylase